MPRPGAIDPMTGLTVGQQSAVGTWTPQGAPAATPAGTPATPPGAPPAQNALGNPNQGPLTGYNNWMTSGGTDPQNWQSLGGSPNTGFLNAGNWTSGGVDPTHVQTNGDPMAGYQPFIDSAYAQSTRQLDPQFAQAQQSFDQQMVNQGIAPGSEAYSTAKTQFDQTKNDAYGQARTNAQNQGMAAQAQSFGQGLSQSQLANALTGQLIGANSSYANQQLGGNASLMNALLSGNSGIANSMIGAAASTLNSSNAAGASMYGNDLQHQYQMGLLNQQGNQLDFGNLMQLAGMGQGVGQYNNSLLTQDQQRQQSMYGGLPGMTGGGQIDASAPYNNQYNGQMNQWQYANNQANAQNSNWTNYAQLAASLWGGGG